MRWCSWSHRPFSVLSRECFEGRSESCNAVGDVALSESCEDNIVTSIYTYTSVNSYSSTFKSSNSPTQAPAHSQAIPSHYYPSHLHSQPPPFHRLLPLPSAETVSYPTPTTHPPLHSPPPAPTNSPPPPHHHIPVAAPTPSEPHKAWQPQYSPPGSTIPAQPCR